MRKVRDLTGVRNGKVTVEGLAYVDKQRRRFWNCLCDCGKRFQTTTGNLIPSHTVSCGCHRASLKRRKNSYLRSIFNNYRRSASVRGLCFELSSEQVEQLSKGSCGYCGANPDRFYRNRGNSDPFLTNGIDRVDNTVGYTQQNCVSCCEKCNFMKRSYSFNEFISHIRNIYKHSVSHEN